MASHALGLSIMGSVVCDMGCMLHHRPTCTRSSPALTGQGCAPCGPAQPPEQAQHPPSHQEWLLPAGLPCTPQNTGTRACMETVLHASTPPGNRSFHLHVQDISKTVPRFNGRFNPQTLALPTLQPRSPHRCLAPRASMRERAALEPPHPLDVRGEELLKVSCSCLGCCPSAPWLHHARVAGRAIFEVSGTIRALLMWASWFLALSSETQIFWLVWGERVAGVGWGGGSLCRSYMSIITVCWLLKGFYGRGPVAEGLPEFVIVYSQDRTAHVYAWCRAWCACISLPSMDVGI